MTLVYIALGLVVLFVAARVLLRGDGTHDAAPTDEEVLAQLSAAGVDLTKPLILDFYLYASDEQSATAIRDALVEDGFETSIEKSEGAPIWVCQASKTLSPSLENIQPITQRMSELAGQHGSQYDGWGAAVPVVGEQ